MIKSLGDLTVGEKKALLSFVLGEAYCCYRRYMVAKALLKKDASMESRLISSDNEMKKHIILAKKIAENLGIMYIDWKDPESFVKFLF